MLNAGETFCPAAIVTDAGTAAAEGSLLESATVIPAAGACPASETVFPVAVTGPITDVAATLNVLSDAGLTVSMVCLVAPLNVAVIVTATGDVTAAVVIVKPLLRLTPCGTNTDAGTAAPGLSCIKKVKVPRSLWAG